MKYKSGQEAGSRINGDLFLIYRGDGGNGQGGYIFWIILPKVATVGVGYSQGSQEGKRNHGVD